MTALPLIKQYQLLTDWYLSVLENVSEADGNHVIGDNQNSITWLAGHLLVGRYRNIGRLGLRIEPYPHLDAFMNQSQPPPNAIAFDRNKTYPSLESCRKQWIQYAEIFLGRLRTVDEQVLTSALPFQLATGNTVEDALTFMAMHESFHIGQMSIMRKHLGYPAMKLGARK